MEFLLHETQKPVALDPHRFRVLCCGRRWGKTTLAIDQMKGRATIPDSRIAYIAPTFQQARDIAWEQLKRELANVGTINESRLEIRLVNGSIIILRGWEAIETLRGQKFDLIVIDEIAMMRNFWMQWQEVIRPTLTDTKGEGLFISTPKGYNHFFDLYEMELRDDDFKSFHFSTYDNPHIPPEEVDKARKEITEDRFAQEYLADFRKTEGLVYKDFNRDVHVYTTKDFETVETILGIDFGWTNPTVILKIEKGRDGVYYISDEWYKTEKTTREIVEMAKSFNPHLVYPDPAEPDRIEELRREGLYTMEVSKDIEAGITSIQQLLRLNRIRIHKDCVNTIAEIESYHYPDKKPDKNEAEVPVKEDDHAMDAMRYALYMNAGMSGRVSVPSTPQESEAFRAMRKRKAAMSRKREPLFNKR